MASGFCNVKFLFKFRFSLAHWHTNPHDFAQHKEPGNDHQCAVSAAENRSDQRNQTLFRSDQEQVTDIQHLSGQRHEEADEHHDQETFMLHHFHQLLLIKEMPDLWGGPADKWIRNQINGKHISDAGVIQHGQHTARAKTTVWTGIRSQKNEKYDQHIRRNAGKADVLNEIRLTYAGKDCRKHKF